MLGDYAGRALIAAGASSTFALDLLVRFASSPGFVPACNLAGAVAAAGYAAWSAKRARGGRKAPSADAVATAAEALASVLAAVAKEFARASAPVVSRPAPTPPPSPHSAPPDDEPGPVS